jgi:diguanylate cyclase (GGDEF)-like protein/PAS domain S-box-containing protein
MNRQRLRQWTAFACAAALILGGVGLAYRLYEQRLQAARGQALDHLVAIADLKAWQIENWIAERTADVVAIGATRSIAAPLRRLLAHPDDARERRALLRALAPFKDAYAYEELFLVDANGELRLSTAAGGGAPSPEALAAARLAMRTRSAQLEHAPAGRAGDTRIAVAAPLLVDLRDGEPVPGAVILRVDPRRFLYPAVRQWPVPSASGEAFLVEQHDGTVFYLTALKFSADTQAVRRLEAPQLLAVMAAGGRRGALEGVDYRGVPVLGAAQKIHGTDWLVVSQMDAAEVYGASRIEAALLASLVLMSLLGAGLGTAYWWRGQQLRVLASDAVARRRAESERETISRLYGALSALNELVARAQSSEELLQGACEIAVASGNFQLAVVRLVDAQTGYAEHAARAGPMPYRYDRALDVREGSPDGESLTALAYRSGRPAIGASAEFATQLSGGGEGEMAVRSAGAYPLFRRGAPLGVLVLRSTASNAFDGESGRLLERMARDVSHGLDSIAADEELRRFRLALDNSADMIVLIDRDTMRFVDVNNTLCRLLGYRREELIGKRAAELVMVPEEELRRAYDELIADPSRKGGLRGQYRCRDGTLLPFESTRHVLREGNRWLVAAVSRDMRERDSAEQALRRKDQYLRSLVENVSDLVAVCDLQWRYIYMSRSCVALTGFAPEEFIGEEFCSATMPADAAALRERLSRELERSSEPQRIRHEIRRKDGEPRIQDIVISRATGPQGEPIYVVVGRDVTEEERRAHEFRTLVQHSPDIITRFGADLRCFFINDAIERATGRPAASFLGKRLREMQTPESFAAQWEAALSKAFGGVEGSLEISYPGRAGPLHYDVRFIPEKDADGAVRSVMTISRDITDRIRADQALAASEQRIRESESRLRGIVQGTLAPLLVVTREGEIVFANPAAAEVLGREPAALPGLPLGLPLANGRPADVDILLPNGDTRAAEMQFAATDFDGREVLVVSLHDLSERRRYELHIEHLANHDALTGLPNRTLLRDRVQQAIVHARRLRSHVGLLFVDLDQFKLVNDSWGHLMGDALLLEVGKRLQRTIREGDTVARLGGDEFVVLLSDLTTPDDTAVVARKIADALAEPLDLEGRSVSVTASIGVSLYPGDGDDMETLLQCADAAMYRAKEAGRNTFQYYGAEMGAQARTRVETESGLRQAIERGELRLYYQPQVSLQTGQVRGFEALLRWLHPQRGLVSPASFIPIAEDSGLILPIGQWALNAACRQAAAWSAGGLGRMKVAVNLSARQFWRGGVTELVRTALGESGLPAAQLELEITESVLARDLQQVMLSLEQLRRLGVTVAIDDFGTGYSSLAYLRSLPIQKLKIDKSFIHGIPGDGEATALVGEIVRLAHVLALEVVAEGVETAEQAQFLREAGCESMQGFLVARPMPGDECAPLLRSKRRFTFGGVESDWTE